MLRYLAPAALLAASGCTDVKRGYETPPVAVSTAQGAVTCQLYTPNAVLWDRALSKPATMSDADANRQCRAEGELRRGKSGTGSPDPS